MQLNVFSTDNQKSGFRLQYMEVYNWGTFDEHVHSIKPQGETSLLTGANGSGKTTFVDALLTLIVPEKRYRFYNQSSGSEKKGDRTEESYVLGGFGTINSESTGATKALYLRENKDEAYSILLANFANEAEQAVTLVQVRYFANGEMKRIFVIASKALHIEENFKPFDTGGNWKKRIDQQFNKGTRKLVEWFDTASKYALRLIDVLGMQSIQALNLFNQTVGIKILGNLDDFIRTHMLEPRDMEDMFQELKKHLSTLLDAQRNIEKTEEQIRLLKPVKQHYEEYRLYQSRVQQITATVETAAIWKTYTNDQLLQSALEAGRDELYSISQKSEHAKQSITKLLEQERLISNQKEQNEAGRHLKKLEADLLELQDKKIKARSDLQAFTAWCSELHLSEKEAKDESSYMRIRKETSKSALRLEREQRLNEDDDFEAKKEFNKSSLEKEKLEAELNVLLQSKSNIPGTLVNLRRQLCSELNIDTNELPFAGELIQVKPEEYQWQPALEKLLHYFSLRLLVPDKYYKKVTRYINKTNTGTRLVYYHVKDSFHSHPDEGTVFQKLDFHNGNKLSIWVQQQIIMQFNYSCVADEKTFERFEKAITVNGLIKNRDRHEKDDRPGRNDAAHYVMGWNNENKKESLIKRRNNLHDIILAAQEMITRCKHKSGRLQGQFYALKRIQEHSGFDLLDEAGIQLQIHKTEQQVNQLKLSSDLLKELTAQLEAVTAQRLKEEEARDKYLGEKSILQNDIARMEHEKEQLQPMLQFLMEADKDALLRFQQTFADRLAKVTLATIENLYKGMKAELDDQKELLRQSLSAEETRLRRSITHIKNPVGALMQKFPDWQGDVLGFSEEVEHAEEYKEWLDKLESENLPKYKKDFENFINDTITYKIGGLNEELDKWARAIETSVQKLNQSLGAINFNRLPDTYIQLGKRSVQDTNVQAFRNDLLEALPQAANWQQNSFEEKALHFRQKVQPLIDKLDESETYRARVMDARNWFEFWADEKYRATGELKKTYRQMGQLSGGEKAQLTYTILCSAIAYQFGITREGKASRSLRFIAVDESFSNQDEDKATYLMELCKQLHLQLLVVTPSDKIQIVQDFIAHVHLVQRVGARHSVLYNMTIKELQQKMENA